MKKNMFLTAVLIGLALIAYLITSRPVKTTTEINENCFQTDSAKVSKIMIFSDKSEITLVKEGKKWLIKNPVNYPADPNRMQSILKSLNNLTVDNVISKSLKKQAKFGVDDSLGIRIKTFYNENLATDFYIGKNSRDYSHTYFRKAKDAKIFVGSQISKYNFNREVKDWRDKTILKHNKDDISMIKIQKTNDSFVFQKDSVGWQGVNAGGNFKVKNSKIDKIQNLLTNFRCTNFNDTISVNDFDITIEYQVADNIEKIYLKHLQNEYLLKKEKSQQFFVISKNNFDVFNQNIKAFKE